DVEVVTRPRFDPKPFNEATIKKTPYMDGRIGDNDPLLEGPDFTRVIEAEKLVRGTVMDDETGKPRPGVTVRLTDPQYQIRDLTGTTDGAGRFEIHGSKKMNKSLVSIPPARGAGYVARQVTAADTPGYEPITADVRVPRGVAVVVRLIDVATG